MKQLSYELPDGWEQHPIADVASLVSGQHLKKDEYTQSETSDSIPYLTGPAEFGELYPTPTRWTRERRSVAISGDTLVTVKGSGVGKVNRVFAPAVAISRQLMAVRPKEVVDPDFLYLYFQAIREVFADKKIGAAIPGIGRRDVLEQIIPVPPIDEQKLIVAKLDALFTRIDAAITHLQETLELSKALFASALSRGFRSKDRSWQEVKLADVCEISSNLTDPREPEWIDMIHVGGANIESLTGELTGLKTAREEKLISGKYPFDQRMVLYSKIRPYLMKVARPSFEGLCSADIYPLSPSPEVLNRDFLFYLLLTEHFTAYANQGSSRAGMPKVNRRHLFDYRFRLPPIAEQSQIAFQLDSLVQQTRTFEAETQDRLTHLTALKSSLLDAAFRGQL